MDHTRFSARNCVDEVKAKYGSAWPDIESHAMELLKSLPLPCHMNQTTREQLLGVCDVVFQCLKL